MPLIPQTLVPKPHTPIVVGPISHTRSSSGLQTPHPEGGGPLPHVPQAHDPKAHIRGVGVPPSHAPVPRSRCHRSLEVAAAASQPDGPGVKAAPSARFKATNKPKVPGTIAQGLLTRWARRAGMGLA